MTQSPTSQQPQPRVLVETAGLREFDSAALKHVVAGAEFEHRRLPGGGSDMHLMQCTLPHAMINRGIYAPAVLVTGTFGRNAITIGTMLRQQQATRVNGINVRSGSLQFYPEDTEMCYRAWPGGTWLTFAICRERMLEFWLELFGTIPRLPNTGVTDIEPKSKALADHLLAGLRDLDHSLRPLSTEQNAARLGQSVERDLNGTPRQHNLPVVGTKKQRRPPAPPVRRDDPRRDEAGGM
jgi:hypothetical protein